MISKVKVVGAVHAVAGAWWDGIRAARAHVLDLPAEPWGPWRYRVGDVLDRAAWLGIDTGCAVVNGIQGPDELAPPREPCDPLRLVEEAVRAAVKLHDRTWQRVPLRWYYAAAKVVGLVAYVNRGPR
jgi:hypothetical protein